MSIDTNKVVRLMRQRRERTKQALASTEFEREESAIVEWLLTSGGMDYDDLRERFPHRLKGVDRDTLERLRALVVGACEALRQGDGDTLRALAAACDDLGDRGTKAKRRRQLYEVLERELTAARRKRRTASESNVAAWQLTNIEPRCAFDGIGRELREQINLVAALPPTSTGNPGRGAKGTNTLLVWLLERSGLATRAQAAEQAKAAAKRPPKAHAKK